MSEISALLIPAEGEVQLQAIDSDDANKEKLIGSNIRYIRINLGDTLHMVVSDNAKKENLSLNIRATCIANSFCKLYLQDAKNLAIFGDAIIEGNCLDEKNNKYQSCSIPPSELVDLIDFCERADIWWHSLGKKIINHSNFKWFIKPIEEEEEI